MPICQTERWWSKLVWKQVRVCGLHSPLSILRKFMKNRDSRPYIPSGEMSSSPLVSHDSLLNHRFHAVRSDFVFSTVFLFTFSPMKVSICANCCASLPSLCSLYIRPSPLIFMFTFVFKQKYRVARSGKKRGKKSAI